MRGAARVRAGVIARVMAMDRVRGEGIPMM